MYIRTNPFALAVIYHPLFSTGGHPALLARYQEAFPRLQSDLFNKTKSQIKLREAVRADETLLPSIHTSAMIERVRKTETFGIHPFEGALYSLGSCALGGELVYKQEAATAFCFTGCPGHHAGRKSQWDFCYFNNAVYTVRHLRRLGFTENILIIDTDAHHGDGTVDALDDDLTVSHLCFHVSSDRPRACENPEQKRYDAVVAAGTGDEEYLNVFNKKLFEVALKEQPRLIIWEFGYDAHKDDYGGLHLTAAGFNKMTGLVKTLSRESGILGPVVQLAGGARPDVGYESIKSVCTALVGNQ